MKLAEKMLERELDRLGPVLVEKALARRVERRPAPVRALSAGKLRTYALVGGGVLAVLSLAGHVMESQRIRRAVRRELRKALDPVEKQLQELKKQTEALHKELQALKK